MQWSLTAPTTPVRPGAPEREKLVARMRPIATPGLMNARCLSGLLLSTILGSLVMTSAPATVAQSPEDLLKAASAKVELGYA